MPLLRSIALVIKSLAGIVTLVFGGLLGGWASLIAGRPRRTGNLGFTIMATLPTLLCFLAIASVSDRVALLDALMMWGVVMLILVADDELGLAHLIANQVKRSAVDDYGDMVAGLCLALPVAILVSQSGRPLGVLLVLVWGGSAHYARWLWDEAMTEKVWINVAERDAFVLGGWSLGFVPTLGFLVSL